jgi:hypothetical protein
MDLESERPGKPTITEDRNGSFTVRAYEAWVVAMEAPRRNNVYEVTIPRDVMLEFLGEFSEKVLQLRLDAVKQAREARDRLEVTRVLPHTGLCVDDHCYCPKQER